MKHQREAGLRARGWLISLLFAPMCGTGCQPTSKPLSSAVASDPSAPRTKSTATVILAEKKSAATEPSEPHSIRFRDISNSTGISFLHVSGNSAEKNFPTANGSGVAMLDYDGDGLLDLYFATTRNLPLSAPTKSMGNRLYRNRGDGTFEDSTERAGVGFHGFTHGLAVGDVDNNGFPDLYLANLGQNVLYLNQGDGTFRDASQTSGVQCGLWSSGAALFDYDRDGDLDLYVSCYGKWAYEDKHLFCGDVEKHVRTYCSPLGISPDRHFLFRNRGDGSFEDVTRTAGVFREDGRGMGIVACDVNRDGWIDLYVANDQCPHFLFLNKCDGTFEDITDVSGAAVSEGGYNQAGMGVDAEDVTGDGLPELFATHFREDYNTLYRNLDGRNFQDVSAWAGIVKDCLPNVSWGCALADFDNDGWPDMLVVNGHVDDNLLALGHDIPQAELSRVWRNQGSGKYRMVSDPGPFFQTGHVARGAAFGDIDNDGDIDVVVSLMDQRPVVLLNESASRAWVRLELLTEKSRRAAIGAAVEVHLEKRIIHRQIKGGGSYHSANDTRLLIGLGDVDHIDRIEIHWPNGTRTSLKNPTLKQTHRILEPRSELSLENSQGIAGS